MNRDIRKLTDGAMMAAIIGVLLVIDRQLAGMISSSALFLFPLPMVFYSSKYGLKNSFMVLAAIFFLLFMLGTPQTIFFVGCESIIGMVYGAGIYNGTDNRRIFLRTIIMGAAVEVLAMIVLAAFFGYDMTADMGEYEKLFSNMMEVTGSEIPAAFDLDSLIKNVFIVSTVLLGVLEGCITHFVSRIMLKRMRMKIPESTPLNQYFPPKWAGYIAMIGMVAYFASFSVRFENETLQNAAQALGMAAMMYLVVFGAIGVAVLLPRMYPKTRSFVPLIIIFLFMTVSYILALIGFLYITTDLHERALKGGLRRE